MNRRHARRARTIALAIVRLRAILIQAYIRATADLPDDDLGVEFDFVARSLPWAIREHDGLVARVIDPTHRSLGRTGLARYVDIRDTRARIAVAERPDEWRAM